jgi:hypothetical protein
MVAPSGKRAGAPFNTMSMGHCPMRAAGGHDLFGTRGV